MDDKLVFSIHGPFVVSTRGGTSLTPRSRKACGLLAILLISPGYRRARIALQDKLWSDRGGSQGAASLRQTLTQIRRSFGSRSSVLVSDRSTVSLQKENVEIDWGAHARGGDFLEGLDVRDPEFEDWLRTARQAEPDTRTTVLHIPRAPTFREDTPVLLLERYSRSHERDIIADYVQNDIARGVADWGGVEIRWSDESGSAPITGPIFRLDCDGRSVGAGVALRLRLIEEPPGRICWQVSEFLPAASTIELGRLINSCVDRTIGTFSGRRPHGAGGAIALEYFSDMQVMFQTQGRDYDRHRRLFADRFEKDGRGIDIAWQAFLSCWAIGERHKRDLQSVREEARELMRRAIEIEPYNAMIHALASHVFGFVLNEYPVAQELASRSIRLDRNCTMGWAFLAAAQINLGRPEKAFESIQHARALSTEGPHKAFLDSLSVMIGIASGNAETVLPIGETLIALRPDYAAPLRYMLAGYLSTGDRARSGRTLQALRNLEPAFDVSDFCEPEYPVATMRNSEFIDLEKIRRLI